LPSTSAIVTRVQELCHGWNRTGSRGVLPILDEIHRYMVGHDSESNVVMNSANGLYPFLVTTDGTYQYDAPDDCRKVAMVLVTSSGRGYDEWKSYEKTTYQGKEYWRVPVTSRPKTRNASAQVIFRTNPGDTTETYYLKYYKDPTEISSASINLDIPEEYHDLVVDGVVARIRQMEYGDSQVYLIWRGERVPMEYWQETNDNADTSSVMPLRYF